MSNKKDDSSGTSRSLSVGIQSIEVGMPLIKILSAASGPLPLSALAAAAGMPRSKAHKYLVSFARVGLITQNAAGGHYDLGPLALDLGLAAMRRLDVVEIAQEVLDSVRDRLDALMSFAIWANRGPTIVRWAEVPHSTSQTVRLGTVLPILCSAVGHTFAAYLDSRLTEPLIQTELNIVDGPAARAGICTAADVETLLASVRADGMAFAESVVAPGFECLAAPIFDHTGGMVASMTIVNIRGRLDISRGSLAARTLREASDALSFRMGARPENHRLKI